MAAAAFNPESFDLLQENHEQRLARDRIKAEDIVPITGPPGTGKSTVISHSCFDLLQEYSPVLIVSPTNAMINSILAKIDYLVNRAKIKLPKGFIIRYGNTAELTYSYPYLNNSYTLDALVHQQHSNIVGSSSGGGIGGSSNKIAIGRDYMQNARIILCTDYIAKDLQRVVQPGAVLVDEAGLVRLDKVGTSFSSLRHNNGKIVVIGDDKQLPPPSHDYVATSLFRSILRYFKTTLLRREYRFNQDILALINPWYDYQLVADQSVIDISTADISKRDYSGTNYNLHKVLKHDKKIVYGCLQCHSHDSLQTTREDVAIASSRRRS